MILLKLTEGPREIGFYKASLHHSANTWWKVSVSKLKFIFKGFMGIVEQFSYGLTQIMIYYK